MMVFQALDEFREGIISLARANVIYEGEAAMERESHDVFAVCAAEDNNLFRVAFFDRPRHRQAGQILLEQGSEADDVVILPGRGVETILQEGRHGTSELFQPRNCIGSGGIRGKRLSVVFLVGWQGISEDGSRKQLLA